MKEVDRHGWGVWEWGVDGWAIVVCRQNTTDEKKNRMSWDNLAVIVIRKQSSVTDTDWRRWKDDDKLNGDGMVTSNRMTAELWRQTEWRRHNDDKQRLVTWQVPVSLKEVLSDVWCNKNACVINVDAQCHAIRRQNQWRHAIRRHDQRRHALRRHEQRRHQCSTTSLSTT